MNEYRKQLPADAPAEPFALLCWITDRLMAPDGCPWDREQTHETIKQYLIEEAYEVYDAVERRDFEHMREELGDVAQQVVFHAALAQEAGRFDIGEVIEGVCEKLVRRHPHVFGDVAVADSAEVLQNWEKIKKKEKAKKEGKDSLLDGVPRHLPGLQKAHRMQEKVRRVGFDWAKTEDVLDKVREEFEELAAARRNGNEADVSEEMGDLLFSLVNASRFLGVQPEDALQSTCRKFAERFHYVEQRAREQGRALDEMTLAEMDALWDEAKRIEATPKECPKSGVRPARGGGL